MDGRVQLPVLQWIKENYPVDFVDVITEAGMDNVLAHQADISEVVRSIKISVNVNKSTRLFVVGHFDCAVILLRKACIISKSAILLLA